MNKYWWKSIQYILLVGIVFLCFFIFAAPTQGKTILTKEQTEKYLNKISAYEIDKVSNPTYGSVGGEWLILGLARYGSLTEEYLNLYLNNLETEVKKCNGILSEKKYTEYARVVLALTAVDVSPNHFAGYDLLSPLAELDNVVRMGMNSVAFSLLAFDCGDYAVPNVSKEYKGIVTTREKLLTLLLKNQLEDGGWSVTGKKSEVDVTAMVLQSLANYSKQDKVKKSIDKAIRWLVSKQNDSGAFSSAGDENCESTAQVMAAMMTLGIEVSDSRFIKNGNSVLDGLLQFYQEGGFKHTKDSFVSQMSTEQAMYALTAYYRNLSDGNRLYDMDDNGNYEYKDESSKRNSPKKVKKSTKKVKKQRTNKNAEQSDIQKNIEEESVTTKNFLTDKGEIKIKTNKKLNQNRLESLKKNKIANTANSVKETKEIKEQKKKDKSNKNYYWLGIIAAIAVFTGTGVLLKRKNKLLIMLMTVCIVLSGCRGSNVNNESAGNCTILVECSTIYDNLEKLENGLKGHIPEDGVILKNQEVSFKKGDSVYDILCRELKKHNVLMEASFTGTSAYIEGIDNVYEFSCGGQSGWLYSVNGEYQQMSCSEYEIKPGDKIEWHYTCDLGEDVR